MQLAFTTEEEPKGEVGPVIHVTLNLSPCTSAYGTSTQLKCGFSFVHSGNVKKKTNQKNNQRADRNYTLFQITPLLWRNISQETNCWMWSLRNEQSPVAVSQQQLSGEEVAQMEKGQCVRGDVKMFNFLFLRYIFRANWSFTQVTPLAKPKRPGEKVTTPSAVNLWQ